MRFSKQLAVQQPNITHVTHVLNVVRVVAQPVFIPGPPVLVPGPTIFVEVPGQTVYVPVKDSTALNKAYNAGRRKAEKKSDTAAVKALMDGVALVKEHPEKFGLKKEEPPSIPVPTPLALATPPPLPHQEPIAEPEQKSTKPKKLGEIWKKQGPELLQDYLKSKPKDPNACKACFHATPWKQGLEILVEARIFHHDDLHTLLSDKHPAAN